jgi:hypothetical protein
MKAHHRSTKIPVRRLAKLFIFSFALLCLFTDVIISVAAGAESKISDALVIRGVAQSPAEEMPEVVVIGLGDSLSHGTMDGTNNSLNTLNSYLQKVVESLAQRISLHFTQPLFDVKEERIDPSLVPTNMAVDGADAFSIEGIEYYKRVGTEESYLSEELLCDEWLPGNLEDKYDKVMYPINVLARQPVSQLDAACWWIKQARIIPGFERVIVILWIGNNDSSLASLGLGGSNPEFLPLPFEQIKYELKPALKGLLRFGQATGEVSFEPFTQAAIERNLTDLQDFIDQYEHILSRLQIETAASAVATDLFVLTLPYYSAVGYLMDSEDIEYYLKKLNPDYSVPHTFKRVAPPGEPIEDPVQGDRISLLTFAMMYGLMSSGYPVGYVNKILEVKGQQQDGLVVSEEEQQYIMSRIDDFNQAIKNAAATHFPSGSLVDIGQYLNDALTGDTTIVVDGHVLSRKWIRGNAFCFDGVHPGYTGQALLANFILKQMNQDMGINAPLYDLSEILADDPYVDQDGDGWAPGPSYEASGITELLFLFKDPDDNDPGTEVRLPPDFWDLISDILLGEILDIPKILSEAERLGLKPPQ